MPRKNRMNSRGKSMAIVLALFAGACAQTQRPAGRGDADPLGARAAGARGGVRRVGRRSDHGADRVRSRRSAAAMGKRLGARRAHAAGRSHARDPERSPAPGPGRCAHRGVDAPDRSLSRRARAARSGSGRAGRDALHRPRRPRGGKLDHDRAGLHGGHARSAPWRGLSRRPPLHERRRTDPVRGSGGRQLHQRPVLARRRRARAVPHALDQHARRLGTIVADDGVPTRRRRPRARRHRHASSTAIAAAARAASRCRRCRPVASFFPSTSTSTAAAGSSRRRGTRSQSKALPRWLRSTSSRRRWWRPASASRSRSGPPTAGSIGRPAPSRRGRSDSTARPCATVPAGGRAIAEVTGLALLRQPGVASIRGPIGRRSTVRALEPDLGAREGKRSDLLGRAPRPHRLRRGAGDARGVLRLRHRGRAARLHGADRARQLARRRRVADAAAAGDRRQRRRSRDRVPRLRVDGAALDRRPPQRDLPSHRLRSGPVRRSADAARALSRPSRRSTARGRPGDSARAHRRRLDAQRPAARAAGRDVLDARHLRVVRQPLPRRTDGRSASSAAPTITAASRGSPARRTSRPWASAEASPRRSRPSGSPTPSSTRCAVCRRTRRRGSARCSTPTSTASRWGPDSRRRSIASSTPASPAPRRSIASTWSRTARSCSLATTRPRRWRPGPGSWSGSSRPPKCFHPRATVRGSIACGKGRSTSAAPPSRRSTRPASTIATPRAWRAIRTRPGGCAITSRRAGGATFSCSSSMARAPTPPSRSTSDRAERSEWAASWCARRRRTSHRCGSRSGSASSTGGRFEHDATFERYADRITLQIVDVAAALDRELEWIDLDAGTPAPTGDYYYLRVNQLDGARAWSSPWWVGGELRAGSASKARAAQRR